MAENTSIAKQIVLVIVGALLGAGVYALVDNCDGFTCSFTDSGEVVSPAVELGTYKEVTTTYVIPQVGDIPELSEPLAANDLSEFTVDLPIAVTSDAYIRAFNDVINLGNQLEVQMRDRLPKTMFTLQTAGENGDFAAAFYAVIAIREEADLTDSINEDFGAAVTALERTLGSVDPAVAVETRTLITAARAAQSATTDFTVHANKLAQPAPPTQEDIDALGPLGMAVDSSLTAFVEGIRDTYNVIKAQSLGS